MIQGSTEEVASPNDTASPWTLVHGFYAGMGGFVFQSNKVSPDHGRLTLTARGVALLAECGLLPDIEREDILDKSKSDGLSKFLACIQAAWMIVQVIGRRIGGLQVTLLEINTLAHVFCALIIYVVWWHKPQLVKKPTTLDGDWTAPLCAYMYMSSRVSGRTKTSTRGNRSMADTEISLVAFDPRKNCPSSCARAGDFHNVAASQYPQDSSYRGSFRLRPMTSQLNQSSLIEASCTETSDEVNAPDNEQNLRWCLAAEAISKYPAIKQRFKTIAFTHVEGNQATYLQEERPEELLVTCSTNWSTEGLLPGQFGLVMGMVLWSVSMVFGGIHAAAWATYFPSKVESKMWRFSSLYISSSGLVWCIINMLAKLWKPVDDYWTRTVLPHPPIAKSIPIVACCVVCGVMYILVRVFLVIEAFISIRQLPASAYETPDWTQLIPHL